MYFRLYLIAVLVATQASTTQARHGQKHNWQQRDDFQRSESTDRTFRDKGYTPKCQTENTFMGIDYSTMGYNILYGYPMENGMDPGFRMPIFNKTFNHLMYTSDCLYMIPVGFDAEPSVYCVTTFTADEVKTEDEFSHSLSNDVSAEFKGWGAHFSSSVSYQKKTNDLSNSENVFVYSTAKCDYYMARLDQVIPPPLDSTFVAFLREIEDSNNQTKYFELFDNFGTHYLKESHMGARYTHEYQLSKQQYEHVSNSQFSISEQAKYTSIFSLSGGDTLTSEQQDAAKAFSSNSSSHTITVGATPEPGGDQEAWASTVKNYPMPMEIKLGSIEEIFEEQYFVGLDIDYNKIKNKIIEFRQYYCWNIPMEDRAKNCIKTNTRQIKEPATERWNGGPTYNQNCMAEQTFMGISYIMMGYNIFTGYPMQLGPDPGFRHPVFNASFANKVFTPDCMYRVPDGLKIVTALSCVTSFSAEEVTNEHEYSSSLSNEASAGFGGWGVHFSASSNYQKNVQEMTKSHGSYVYSTATCNYFYSRLNPYFPPPLHNSFVKYLQNLESSVDDEAAFFEFFDMFGTHYIKEAYSGARYTHEYKLTEEQHSHVQQSSFSVESQAEYASIFSLSGGDKLTIDQKQAAQDFSKHSSSVTITVGATPTSGDDPDVWASTVKQYPLPMKIVLGSIEEIFQAQFFTDVPVDYRKIRDAVLKYKPKYCKNIEDKTGLENVCKAEVSECYPSGPGPHNWQCLNHWWVSAGCNLDGSASPHRNDTSVSYWNTLDAASVFANMRSYKINADNDVPDYYTMCFGSSSDCGLYSRPPHKLSCLVTWWLNAKCQLSGELCPTQGEGYKIWFDKNARAVRAGMVTVRRGTDSGDLNYYMDCMDKSDACPLEGGTPQIEDCLEAWWEYEGCFVGGVQSPQNSHTNVQRWTTMAAEDVRREMHTIHAQALNNDPAGAFQDCFGITPASP